MLNTITAKMELKETKLKPCIKYKANIPEDNIVTFESFLSLIQKDRDKRTPSNIKLMINYLSSNYKYFINLKKTAHSDLMYRLVSSLNYEFFKKHQRIINCGEEGNKFYILLKGKVSVYKPIPTSEEISFKDYVEYICKIKYKEKNEPKFNRITSQNAQIDHYSLYKMNYNYSEIKPSRIKQNYILEEEKKLAEFTDGFSFGEMALIKREPRNASIYAEEDSILVSLEKSDYNKVIKEIEEKRLLDQATEFKSKYPLFNYWGINQLFRLFNYFEKETISYGEYLYKQNQASDYIYFIENGLFEVTSVFSLAWYEEFIDFIHDTTYSIVNKIHQRDIFDNDENFREFLKEGLNSIQSPCIFHKQNKKKVQMRSEKKENVLDVKLAQDNINNPKNLHHATIKQLSIPECLGYDDALELKPRFTSVRCLSSLVEYRKVNIVQFIKLLPYDPVNQYIFQKNIFEKKSFLMRQLKNNAMFRMSSIDNTLKEKFIIAIKKEYPFKPKTYVNDKKMVKILRKSETTNDVHVNNMLKESDINTIRIKDRKPKSDFIHSFNKLINDPVQIYKSHHHQLDKLLSSPQNKEHTNQTQKELSELKKKKLNTNHSFASLSQLTLNNESVNDVLMMKCKNESFRDNSRLGNTSRSIKNKQQASYNEHNEHSELSTKLIEGHCFINVNNSLQMNKSCIGMIMNGSNNLSCSLTKVKNTSMLINNNNKINMGNLYTPNCDILSRQLPKLASYCLEAIAKEKENSKCFHKLQNKNIFLKKKINE